MNRVCDAGGICQHSPQCEHFCHFTEAGLEPVYIKNAMIHFSDEPTPVSDTWHRIGAFMLWSIFVVLAVICLALFFTGLYIWRLLI
jgi:hypothetical protein